MAILKINGVTMPEPMAQTVQLSDLDSENTDRNSLGILKRDRVRAGVYKLSYTFRLTQNESIALGNAISNAYFDVTFIDPTKATPITTKMYAGDRQMEYVQINGGHMWDITVDFIEY